MKKIISFKKDVILNTPISEITSISLEHNLKVDNDNLITGEFIVSGEYKISDNSTNTEVFNYNIPFDIHMSDRYDLNNAVVDIYDFYYEIVNSNILSLHIEVCVNNFSEIKEEVKEELVREVIEPIVETKEESIEEVNEVDTVKEINSILPNDLDNNETYVTYKVYMVKENDSLEMIMDTYQVSQDKLEEYNDLTELKIGDKLIIPQS